MSNNETPVKHFFYYIRNKFNQHKTTVCIAISQTSIARGMTICSKKLTPKKEIGRTIAKGRADKGIETGLDFMDKESKFFTVVSNPILSKIEMRFLESYQKQISA